VIAVCPAYPELSVVADAVMGIRHASLVDRNCEECGKRIPKGSRTDKQYCSQKCRQSAYRKRKKEAA
jgi:hypothetical protein